MTDIGHNSKARLEALKARAEELAKHDLANINNLAQLHAAAERAKMLIEVEKEAREIADGLTADAKTTIKAVTALAKPVIDYTEDERRALRDAGAGYIERMDAQMAKAGGPPTEKVPPSPSGVAVKIKRGVRATGAPALEDLPWDVIREYIDPAAVHAAMVKAFERGAWPEEYASYIEPTVQVIYG